MFRTGSHALEPRNAEKVERIAQGLPDRGHEREAALSLRSGAEHRHRMVEPIELIGEVVRVPGDRLDMGGAGGVDHGPRQSGHDPDERALLGVREPGRIEGERAGVDPGFRRRLEARAYEYWTNGPLRPSNESASSQRKTTGFSGATRATW